jgi:peptidoglycan/LPS O-acetylase OafA/YrhL
VSAPSQRNESLDVLRCVAVLLVVGYHLPYYTLWSRIGWIGVDLFFVLSGFLISGLLFQEYKDTGTLSIKRFLIRRGLKIYPSFYLLMVLVTCLYFLDRSTVSTEQLALSWIFLQNYFSGGRIFIILVHTWSLAVEEHFYLMFPFVLMALIAVFPKRDPFRLIPALFLAIAASCLGFRYFTLAPDHWAWMTHMRIDGLFAGVALGYFYHFRRNVFERLTGHYALVVAFVLCLPAALLDGRGRAMQTFGLTGLLVGFSFLVAWCVVRTPRTLVGRALSKCAAKVGFYSYSIYVWHTVLVDAFEFHPSMSAAKFWVYIASTIVAGIAMAHLIEMPYLALRERLFPPSWTAARLEGSPAAVAEFSAVSARPA